MYSQFMMHVQKNIKFLERNYWIKLSSDTYGPRCRQFNLRLVSYIYFRNINPVTLPRSISKDCH